MINPAAHKAGVSIRKSTQSPVRTPSQPLSGSSKDLPQDMLIPDNEGRVKHMLLTPDFSGFSVGDSGHPQSIDVIKTLITKMPEARFTVVTDEGSRSDFAALIDGWTDEGIIGDASRIQLATSESRLTKWAQDPFLVAGNKVIHQANCKFDDKRIGDDVPSVIASMDGSLEADSSETLFIDGGNQKPTRDKVFVGSEAISLAVERMKDYPQAFYDNAEKLRIKDPESLKPEKLAKSIVAKSFPHQEIVYVGEDDKQPAFHIDMMSTPLNRKDPETGKPVMLVGDPEMTLELLDSLKKDKPEALDEFKKAVSKRSVFVSEQYLERLSKQVRSEPETLEQFRKAADTFENEGYHVVRVPYLGSDFKNKPGGSDQRTPWVTYNNSIIDGDRAFVPKFGFEPLDELGHKAYSDRGYEVIPVEIDLVTTGQGALNCMTKVLERDYGVSSSTTRSV